MAMIIYIIQSLIIENISRLKLVIILFMLMINMAYNINEVANKLQTRSSQITEYNLKINWNKEIHNEQNVQEATTPIRNLHGPFNQISVVNNAKIMGHQCS